MKSTLSASDCSILWAQISSALADLHAQSVIHDDVKPDNMMWDNERKHAVLIDFGAALIQDGPVEFNPSGTPPYAPPEFLQRRKGMEGDVWALGVTILFALRYVHLPDGDWILPYVFQDEAVLQEMMAWLAEVEGLRRELIGTNMLLAEMLDADPDTRVKSPEVVRRLKAL
jgi:serine/threonine protein kinase